VIEAVGTQEAMLQAIVAAPARGHVGYVGLSHNVSGDKAMHERRTTKVLLTV
jgi:threonine dehydrogenase-like Zn-dependent dehydrogenase